MAEEPDRLSELPDELLHHILHLAPCREAETTSVLSRRWRGLWPSPTGAVKIDIHPGYDPNRRGVPNALLRAAEEAIAASHGPMERLAIDVGVGCNDDDYVEAVGHVLSHPASHGVQDVRISAATSRGDDDDDSWRSMPCIPGEFEFRFTRVPWAALRVLHITNCRDDDDATPPPLSFAFPYLEVLRLRRCMVTLERLQDMVAASPQLAALQLEYVHLPIDPHNYNYLPKSFCCPGITTLVLLNCFCEQKDDVALELDVPRVQHFKYRGKINQFTLRSPPPDVRRAYLHILPSNPIGVRHVKTCESFWNFLKNFSHSKVLKLKLEWTIDYVAALERERIRELLIAGENQNAQWIMFCVEHLEIDAPYYPESSDVGVAIGILLQYCPAIHDLRLKLNTDHQHRWRNQITYSLQSKAQLDFHKSIDHFRHRKDDPVVPLCGDDHHKFEVSDIPGLSDRWFHIGCLKFHLKRLSLQFHMDKDGPNCLGVRLARFFIERGIALEEMYIDDGNMKLWEHMNCKISGYAAANPQPFSEYHVLARMSQALSMKQFSSSSKISGLFHHHKLEVRRTKPWSARRSFTILPLEDT